VSQRGGDWPLHVGAGGHAGGLGTGHRTSFGGGGISVGARELGLHVCWTVVTPAGQTWV
jgi:hypothetical protein